MAGLGGGDFPSAQRDGNRGHSVKGGHPSIAGDGVGLQEKGDAVGGVEVGSRLLAGGDPAESSLGEAMKGLEDDLVGGV